MNTSALPTGPLNTSQLNEQVYEVLKAEILGGNLIPGQRLSIHGLARHLGVSATPVRDALRRLHADNLVEVIPRRGTFIARFSRVSIQEAFQSRRIIECAAVEMLAEAPNEPGQQVGRIDKLGHRMEEILEEVESLRDGEKFLDYARATALDEEFHECIMELLGNRSMTEFYRSLRLPAQMLRRHYSEYQRARDTVIEHAAILEAIERKDVLQAKKAIIHHLTRAEADLLGLMASADWPESTANEEGDQGARRSARHLTWKAAGPSRFSTGRVLPSEVRPGTDARAVTHG